MFDEKENVIRYKWDHWTGSGYRLRFDATDQSHRFRVEDWNNHVVVDDYGCADLDEALKVLNRFFDIDPAQERSRIAEWLPVHAI
ncbi:MAG TPA: hypothetical protein DDY14_12770 [Chromatiaceae bacterium]|jgi:hypothetical protein|nr:MAG: hypothetical protein N838_34295 [Thiohalocapsa sp. PB-PSB1]QQO55208.1 MAG: hypothetical protein N838_19505 [Thiohalocapsa sp. PB-PSB1]HBG96153.1 hypothetical protein [Chromatiaceae bacterium]HCS92848.1 hypothetical protein [Chromatiaceae bacterium]